MDNYKDIKNKVLNELNEVLDSISDVQLNNIVNFLCLNKESKILGYAAGRMGIALKSFIMRLNHLGFNAYYYGDTYIPPMTDKDIFICCSNSGSTKSVYNILDIFKNKAKGFVISFVGDDMSVIAKNSDMICKFKTCNGGLNSEDNPNKINSIQPMTTLTEQAMMILFDLIVMLIIKENNINIKDTKQYHSNIE